MAHQKIDFVSFVTTSRDDKALRSAGRRPIRWLVAVAFLVVAVGAGTMLALRKSDDFYWHGRKIHLQSRSMQQGGLSEKKFWVHDFWDGPTGEWTRGDFYGVRFGHKLFGLDVTYDPIGAIKRSLPKSLPGLLTKLNTKDPLVFQCVVETLKQFGPEAKPAIPILLARCTNGDDFVAGAIVELARSAGPASIPILSDALTNDDTRIVAKAIETLGELGTNAVAAIPILSSLLKNSCSTNVLASAYALRKITTENHGEVESLIRLLDDGDPQVQRGTIFVLGEFGADASEAVVPLLRFLDPARPEITGWTARTLGMIGSAAQIAIPRLVTVLNERNPTNIVFIMEALGAFGDRASVAVPILCEIAKDSPESRERTEAIKSLAAIGTNSIPCLLALYESRKSPYTSLSRALTTLGTAAAPALPVLLQELGAEKPYRAAAAAMALGSIGAPARGAVPRLTELLQSADPHLRIRSAEALWRIDRQTNLILAVMIQELDEWSKGPSALVEYAEDRHGQSRQQIAARILGEIGPSAREAIPVLQTLQRSAFDEQRRAATEALEKISRGE